MRAHVAGRCRWRRSTATSSIPIVYSFLEGRPIEAWQTLERIEPPRVADGTIHRVLEKLIVLDGERISYRALDVEHIGSVYETMMGFRLERATGRSIAIKAVKKHGAPTTVDIEAFMNEEPGKRAKWMQDRTDRKLTAKVSQERSVGGASTIEELHSALDPVSRPQRDTRPRAGRSHGAATERGAPTFGLSLHTAQTHRAHCARTALEPILARLSEESGGSVHPEQVLDLKVCDPAMGSGAFLVEACRQLAEALIEAWRAHDVTPGIPPDENEEILARRLVAQRCLYGVEPQPESSRPRQAVTLADHPGQGPSPDLPRSRPPPRRFPGRALDPPATGLSLEGQARLIFAAGFEALRGQEHLDRATVATAQRHSRGRRRVYSTGSGATGCGRQRKRPTGGTTTRGPRRWQPSSTNPRPRSTRGPTQTVRGPGAYGGETEQYDGTGWPNYVTTIHRWPPTIGRGRVPRSLRPSESPASTPLSATRHSLAVITTVVTCQLGSWLQGLAETIFIKIVRVGSADLVAHFFPSQFRSLNPLGSGTSGLDRKQYDRSR